MSDFTEIEKTEGNKKVANVPIHILVNTLTIIDVANKRGAYKSEELTFVGSIYDILSRGVKSAYELSRTEIKEENEKKENEKLETVTEKLETVTDEDLIEKYTKEEKHPEDKKEGKFERVLSEIFDKEKEKEKEKIVEKPKPTLSSNFNVL